MSSTPHTTRQNGRQTGRRTDDDLTRPVSTHGWRIVDIVVAAVLGVACGLVFYAYNGPGNAFWLWLDALTPGLAGVANGPWLLGGPLGGLIVRKPGAAILVEGLAALVSMALGNQWGLSTLWIGLVQGLGAELAFLLWRYRSSALPVAVLSGALAGVGCWLYSLVTAGLEMTVAYNVLYVVGSAVSGAIVGILAWVLLHMLRATGALNRFASARG